MNEPPWFAIDPETGTHFDLDKTSIEVDGITYVECNHGILRRDWHRCEFYGEFFP